MEPMVVSSRIGGSSRTGGSSRIGGSSETHWQQWSWARAELGERAGSRGWRGAVSIPKGEAVGEATLKVEAAAAASHRDP